MVAMPMVPTSSKRNDSEGKLILKRAMAPYLSPEILYRPKMGFAVPLASWFRGPLSQRVRTALLGPTLAATGLFNPAGLQRILDEHQTRVADHSVALWSLLMFESFVRQVLDGHFHLKELTP